MWNLKSSNRILDLQSKREAHLRHLRALKNVKSKINNSQPKKFTFLNYKAKTALLAKQKTRQIEHCNSLLVNRMITMPSSLEGFRDVYFKESLNSGMMRKLQQKIDVENQKIVKRLYSANSQYSQKAMAKSIYSYHKAKTNLASSKMDQYYDFQGNGQYSSFNQEHQMKQHRPNARPFSAKK